MAIKSLIQMFASFLGYELPDSSGSTGSILDSMDDSLGGVSDGIDDVNSGLDDTSTGLDKAKKKAKELAGALGIDELHTFGKNTDDSTGSGSGGAGGTGGMSVDPRLLKALQDMDYLFGNIRMKAMDIRDQLLEWASILGKVVDDNIFEPIRNSWNKYGASIGQNMQEIISNIKYMWMDFFEVVGRKWKPFFQALSDLFFSLLDTATLVLTTIQKFFRHVWDSGGKYLFESLWDLATAFLKLATSINDNFVEPVINWLKRNIVPAFGDLVGTILKGIGIIVKGFANVITWIAKCKPVIITVTSAAAAFFAAWKMAMIIDSVSKAGGVISFLANLASKMATNSRVISVLRNSYINLKTAWQLGNEVFKTLFTKIAMSASLYAQSTSAVGGLTIAQTLCAKAAGLLSTVMTALAAHPMLAVVGAITAVIAAIALLGSTQKEKQYEMDDYSKSVQDQINALDDLKKSMDDARASTDKEISSKMAEYKRLEQNVDILRRMAGETGYVDSIEQAKEKVEAINKELPETVKLTKEGRIEWLKTPDAIQKNIDKLKEKARQEAYEKLYVQYIQAQIEAEAKQAESRDKLNKLSERKLELSKQIQQAAADGDSEKLGKLSKDLDQVNADLDGTEKALKKANKAVDAAKKKQDGLDKTLGNVTSSTNGLTEELGKFYAQFGLSDKKAAEFEKLAKKMKATNKTMESCMKDGKVINQKEYDDTKKTREMLVKEYAEKAKKYKLSSDDIIKIAKENGIEISKKELEQAQESLNNAEKSKNDIAKVKKQQNTELLSLLDKLGIDKDSKLGKQYQDELKKAQENGTKSGEDYIKNIKKGISSGDISPNAQEQWNRGQKIFDNPLTALAKVLGAENAGKSAYDTLASFIVKTFYGAVKTKGAYDAAQSAASTIREKVKSFTSTIKATIDKASLNNVCNQMSSAISSMKFKLNTDSVASGHAGMYYQQYATGGFPDLGQIFIAREAGPELVGTMNGRNAVVNNNQIIAGIEGGVARGMAAVMSMFNSGENKSDRTVIENHIHVEMNGREIAEAIDEVKSKDGFDFGMGRK